MLVVNHAYPQKQILRNLNLVFVFEGYWSLSQLNEWRLSCIQFTSMADFQPVEHE